MTEKHNYEMSRSTLLCPYCASCNDPTDFEADGVLNGETDCVKCEKVFSFAIEYDPTYRTETIKEKDA